MTLIIKPTSDDDTHDKDRWSAVDYDPLGAFILNYLSFPPTVFNS